MYIPTNYYVLRNKTKQKIPKFEIFWWQKYIGPNVFSRIFITIMIAIISLFYYFFNLVNIRHARCRMILGYIVQYCAVHGQRTGSIHARLFYDGLLLLFPFGNRSKKKYIYHCLVYIDITKIIVGSFSSQNAVDIIFYTIIGNNINSQYRYRFIKRKKISRGFT